MIILEEKQIVKRKTFICEISIIIILICQKLGSVGPVQHNNIKLNCLHLIWINVNALKVIQVNGE